MGDSPSRLGTGARLAAVTILAGLSTLAVASLAQANDPPGSNGTIKIDGLAYDDDVNNEPHVTCEFRVKFENFDTAEHTDIKFQVWPPTGDGAVLLEQKNVLVSDDDAHGAKNDPDFTFTYTTEQLGLDAYTPHPKQGYHVKLTVTRLSSPKTPKHKVFWVQPCVTSPSPSGSESTSGSTPPPPPTTGASGAGGGLPITGPAAGGIALAGLGLTGAGVALVVMRRRRGIEFTS